jgi:hypothetical protein
MSPDGIIYSKCMRLEKRSGPYGILSVRVKRGVINPEKEAKKK